MWLAFFSPHQPRLATEHAIKKEGMARHALATIRVARVGDQIWFASFSWGRGLASVVRTLQPDQASDCVPVLPEKRYMHEVVSEMRERAVIEHAAPADQRPHTVPTSLPFSLPTRAHDASLVMTSSISPDGASVQCGQSAAPSKRDEMTRLTERLSDMGFKHRSTQERHETEQARLKRRLVDLALAKEEARQQHIHELGLRDVEIARLKTEMSRSARENTTARYDTINRQMGDIARLKSELAGYYNRAWAEFQLEQAKEELKREVGSLLARITTLEQQETELRAQNEEMLGRNALLAQYAQGRRIDDATHDRAV